MQIAGVSPADGDRIHQLAAAEWRRRHPGSGVPSVDPPRVLTADEGRDFAELNALIQWYWQHENPHAWPGNRPQLLRPALPATAPAYVAPGSCPNGHLIQDPWGHTRCPGCGAEYSQLAIRQAQDYWQRVSGRQWLAQPLSGI